VKKSVWIIIFLCLLLMLGCGTQNGETTSANETVMIPDGLSTLEIRVPAEENKYISNEMLSLISVLSSIIIGACTVGIAYQTQRIARNQVEITKLQNRPIIKPRTKLIFDPSRNRYVQEHLYIEVSNGAVEELEVNHLEVLRVRRMRDPKAKNKDIPIYYYGINTGSLTHYSEMVFMPYLNENNHEAYVNLWRAANSHGIDVDLIRYVYIKYTNIYNETVEEVFCVSHNGYKKMTAEDFEWFKERLEPVHAKYICDVQIQDLLEALN